MSVLADHRADPGDDVPAAPSARADDDLAATSIDPALDGATRIAPASDVERRPGRAPGGALRPDQLRADFGAHFEAHYQRLVAQLYAITLNPAEAHDVVREAYSRAWRRWAEVGASADPTGWVRRVAVRSTMRSWRRTIARLAPGRRRGRSSTVASPGPASPSSRSAGSPTPSAAPSCWSTWRACPSSRSRRWSRCRRGRSPHGCPGPAGSWATPWPTSSPPPRLDRPLRTQWSLVSGPAKEIS